MKLFLFQLVDKLKAGCWPLYWFLYRNYKCLNERIEMRLMRQVVQPGSSVIDVGANVGFYTRYLSTLVGPRGRVYAFEPSPSNFRFLQRNCGHLANVVLEQAAIGSVTGKVVLFESPDLNVDHRCYDDGEKRHRVEVACYSIDDYLTALSSQDQIECLSFVKMDVQGYEGQALEGMQNTLRKHFGVSLLSEIFPEGLRMAGRSSEGFLQAMTKLGFNIWLLNGHKLEDVRNIEFSAWQKDRYGNLFAWKRPLAPSC